MSFNVQFRVAGDRALSALTDKVNEQLRQAPEHEHDLLRSGADMLENAIASGEGANEDHSVDASMSGSITDNQRTVSISVSVHRIRNQTTTRTAPEVAPWSPRNDPRSKNRAERDGG